MPPLHCKQQSHAGFSVVDLRFSLAKPKMSISRREGTGPKTVAGKARIAAAETVHGHETKLARAERSAGSAKLHRIEDAMHLLGMTNAPRTIGRKPRGYEQLKTLDDVRQMVIDSF
jgi:hypothetical protein